MEVTQMKLTPLISLLVRSAGSSYSKRICDQMKDEEYVELFEEIRKRLNYSNTSYITNGSINNRFIKITTAVDIASYYERRFRIGITMEVEDITEINDIEDFRNYLFPNTNTKSARNT